MLEISFKRLLFIPLLFVVQLKIEAQSFQKEAPLNVLDSILRNLQDEVFSSGDTTLLKNRILPIIRELRSKDKVANLYADYIETYYHICFPWEVRGGYEPTNNEHYKKAVKMLPILKQQNAEMEYEDNFEKVKLEAYIYYLEYLLSYYHNDKTQTLRFALFAYETMAKYPRKAYLRAQIIEYVGHFYLANAESELAFKYLDEAEKALSDEDVVTTKVQVYNNLGLYYRQANNSEKALFYYHKIPPLVEHTRLEFWKGLVSGNIAVEYEKIKDWNNAKKYIEVDYEYSIKLKQWDSATLDAAAIIRFKIELKEKTGYKDLLISLDTLEHKCVHNKSKEAIYVAKVKYYTYINDFKTANACYSKLYEISKIVYEEELNSKIKSETSKYDLEKEQANRQIAEKEKEFFLMQRNVAIIALLFILLTAFYSYRNTQKRIKAEIEKEAILTQRAKELEELNQYKTQLFSIMAHDLKAPALAFQNIVNSMNSLLRAKQYDLLEDIGAHAEVLASNLLLTVNNLFQKNLIDQGNFKVRKREVNLYHLLLQVQKENAALMTFKKITSQIKIADYWKENDCETYAEVISIIMRNLWSNAIKFSKEGGHIFVEVEYIDHNKMYIKVVDDGIGMSEENLKNIFKGLPQNRKSGTNGERGSGLGLMLCKQLAERFEMDLSCQSTLNQGTAFTVVTHVTQNKPEVLKLEYA